MAVAGTTIAGIVTLLIIVFNMGKQESSYAESLMVFESADVIQDTASVFRGSINQAILGVEVKTSGNKNPVKLSVITFSAAGTTEPALKNIENARLWCAACMILLPVLGWRRCQDAAVPANAYPATVVDFNDFQHS